MWCDCVINEDSEKQQHAVLANIVSICLRRVCGGEDACDKAYRPLNRLTTLLRPTQALTFVLGGIFYQPGWIIACVLSFDGPP
jgi:hypothetical protein